MLYGKCFIITLQVSLRFSVPEKPGIYNYQAVVRSDSYIDFDMYQNFKVIINTDYLDIEIGHIFLIHCYLIIIFNRKELVFLKIILN